MRVADTAGPVIKNVTGAERWFDPGRGPGHRPGLWRQPLEGKVRPLKGYYILFAMEVKVLLKLVPVS